MLLLSLMIGLATASSGADYTSYKKEDIHTGPTYPEEKALPTRYSACPDGYSTGPDGSCVKPKVSKDVYLFSAPDQHVNFRPASKLPHPKVHYNYVFVKTPDKVIGPNPLVVPPPKQKTLVYVLNKKQHEHEQEVIEVPTVHSQPEVFFVNYEDGDNPVLPGGIDLQTALAQENGGISHLSAGNSALLNSLQNEHLLQNHVKQHGWDEHGSFPQLSNLQGLSHNNKVNLHDNLLTTGFAGGAGLSSVSHNSKVNLHDNLLTTGFGGGAGLSSVSHNSKVNLHDNLLTAGFGGGAGLSSVSHNGKANVHDNLLSVGFAGGVDLSSALQNIGHHNIRNLRSSIPETGHKIADQFQRGGTTSFGNNIRGEADFIDRSLEDTRIHDFETNLRDIIKERPLKFGGGGIKKQETEQRTLGGNILKGGADFFRNHRFEDIKSFIPTSHAHKSLPKFGGGGVNQDTAHNDIVRGSNLWRGAGSQSNRQVDSFKDDSLQILRDMNKDDLLDEDVGKAVLMSQTFRNILDKKGDGSSRDTFISGNDYDRRIFDPSFRGTFDSADLFSSAGKNTGGLHDPASEFENSRASRLEFVDHRPSGLDASETNQRRNFYTDRPNYENLRRNLRRRAFRRRSGQEGNNRSKWRNFRPSKRIS